MTRELIHRGGLCNASVFKVTGDGGDVHIEKDFSDAPWIVRNTLGRFLVWRETWILRRLAKTGAVPTGVRRLSAFCLREDFLEGRMLQDFRLRAIAGEKGEILPKSFFEAFEDGVARCHRTGFVHLDLHNARNIMVTSDLRPVFLDWQSAVPTFLLIPPLRRALERIDLAGIYKFWDIVRPGELPPEKMRFLGRSRIIRRLFWIPALHRPESAGLGGRACE
jgi:RIO-like serine/threonine protein kinase